MLPTTKPHSSHSCFLMNPRLRRFLTGVIGELAAGRADIAAFPLSLAPGRPDAIDMTYSFLESGIGMVVKKRVRMSVAQATGKSFHILPSCELEVLQAAKAYRLPGDSTISGQERGVIVFAQVYFEYKGFQRSRCFCAMSSPCHRLDHKEAECFPKRDGAACLKKRGFLSVQRFYRGPK